MKKKSIDFIFLILNCKKYLYKSEFQKKIWLHRLPQNIKYFHIIGDIELCGENDYIIDEVNNKLYVNTPDDYNSLPNKIISAINSINQNYKYKYILKSDDDQIMINYKYFQNIINMLEESINIYHYGGFFVNCRDHISQYWRVHNCLPKNLFLKATKYCNGRFYILSYELVQELLKKSESIKKTIIEDHSIGLYIPDSYKKKSFNIENPFGIFIDIEEWIINNSEYKKIFDNLKQQIL